VRRDYGRFLHETADFTLERETPAPPMPRIVATD
jgi:hypothetical protein